MKLSTDEISRLLAIVPDWKFSDNRGGLLKRDIVFADFIQAFGLMSQVALYAEKHDHHPEWLNIYNRVEVTLTTHDVGGLSMKDFELARFVDEMVARFAAA